MTSCSSGRGDRGPRAAAGVRARACEGDRAGFRKRTPVPFVCDTARRRQPSGRLGSFGRSVWGHRELRPGFNSATLTPATGLRLRETGPDGRGWRPDRGVATYLTSHLRKRGAALPARIRVCADRSDAGTRGPSQARPDPSRGPCGLHLARPDSHHGPRAARVLPCCCQSSPATVTSGPRQARGLRRALRRRARPRRAHPSILSQGVLP